MTDLERKLAEAMAVANTEVDDPYAVASIAMSVIRAHLADPAVVERAARATSLIVGYTEEQFDAELNFPDKLPWFVMLWDWTRAALASVVEG